MRLRFFMIKEISKNKKIKNKKKHHLTYFYSNMHEKSKDIYTIFEILKSNYKVS